MAADVVSSDVTEPSSKIMIWSEEEAEKKQIEQVGASACGATAALNVLNALALQADVEETIAAVRTRLRDLEAPLPQYLLSRSVAGTTHTDIIEGIKILSKNKIFGKFFHFSPERVVDIASWIKKWLHLGGVPVVTLNCQKLKNSDGTIPDAWHHQMVYGVSNAGIHMTNPFQVLENEQLFTQVCSESVLLIHRYDVITRWSLEMDTTPLNTGRWKELNVVEQIERMIKEETLKMVYGSDLKFQELETSHLKIPAAYKSGVTIFARTGSLAYEHLQNAEELPVKQNNATYNIET